MANKLIEAATAARHQRHREYSVEEIELALAWLQGKVGYKGLARATKHTGSTVYGFIAGALKEAHVRKWIIIKHKL